jgi:pimeloyl-ACP methyl ester carboxylesterase
MTWADYDALAARVFAQFEGRFELRSFEYLHPLELQTAAPARFRRPYPVRCSYLTWGDASAPLLICMGGVANVARRFDYLAAALSDSFFVVCPDWLGRGDSGWLRDVGDYSRASYTAQVRQLLAHLPPRPVCLLGSSMGATVAIELAAELPDRVARLVLNDTGPFIPAAARIARAETLARHYVFRSPAEMFRRVGASQKNDGPVSAEVRLHNAHAQTRWSPEEGGRVYRYDLRAMLAYRDGARAAVDQWDAWSRIDCPVLLTWGAESNALSGETVARMRDKPALTVMGIPHTGHTPALADGNHISLIRDWLLGGAEIAGDFSAPYSHRALG